MRYFSRRSLLSLARVLLATLLFAQAALAAQPCVLPDAAPAQAYEQDMPPCHQQETSPNGCLAHCLEGYQLVDQHQPLPALPAVSTAALTLAALPVAAAPTAGFQPLLLARVTGPPLSILHQRFRF